MYVWYWLYSQLEKNNFQEKNVNFFIFAYGVLEGADLWKNCLVVMERKDILLIDDSF